MKLIIVKTKNTGWGIGYKGRGGVRTCISIRKRRGNMNLEKKYMYVCLGKKEVEEIPGFSGLRLPLKSLQKNLTPPITPP